MKGKFINIQSPGFDRKQSEPIQIELYLRRGLPNYQVSGWSQKSIRESKERIRAGIESSGFHFPLGSITINLTDFGNLPVPQLLDLPIALGILIVSRQIPYRDIYNNSLVLGELGLDGRVKKLQDLTFLLEKGSEEYNYILPFENNEGIENRFGISAELIAHLSEFSEPEKIHRLEENHVDKKKFYQKLILQKKETEKQKLPKLELYPGQILGFESLKIALAGRHNLLILGSPGSGKTLLGELASHLQTFPSYEEWREISTYHPSLPEEEIGRPFRMPHHSITSAGLIGGGSELEMGEISKAHNGILFLDELGEIPGKILQNLREPMDTGQIHLTRKNNSIVLHSDFQLIATSNLCPCGQYSSQDNNCLCKKEQIKAYLGKLSGPFVDRMDMIVEIFNPNRIQGERMQIDLVSVKNEIETAQSIHKQRLIDLKSEKWNFSRNRSKDQLKLIMNWQENDYKNWEEYASNSNLGFRIREKVLSVSRTIADFNASERVELSHILSAIALREGSNSIKKFTG